MGLGLAHLLCPQQHLDPFGEYVAYVLLGQVRMVGMSLYHRAVLAIQVGPHIS